MPEEPSGRGSRQSASIMPPIRPAMRLRPAPRLRNYHDATGLHTCTMRIDGHADPRFEPVRDALADVLAVQQGPGAGVAAWADGSWVVDLWGGNADVAGRPWQRDSLVQPYSVTKPFAAISALVLADR